MDRIKNYLGVDELDYDVALLDVDTPEIAINFEIEKNYKNCFVTAFDVYSLRRGTEVLEIFKKPVKVIKVLFSKNLLKEENEYLDYITLGSKVVWDKEVISFPLELGNYSVAIINQIIARIKMKKLSDHYKNSLVYLMTMLFEDEMKSSEIKKIIKNIERE
ncbi:MAG: hypothetical protein HFJ50_09055 [Clostridia bacterium]|nr:hypothetical protein [Clostridia bacterium]